MKAFKQNAAAWVCAIIGLPFVLVGFVFSFGTSMFLIGRQAWEDFNDWMGESA